jgi:hypothetical protein
MTKDEGPVAGSEPATRRSLLKSLALGTVAAGAIAGSAKAAESVGATGELRVRRNVRVVFEQRKPPNLDDVFAALEKAAGEAGCTRCGLDGIDIKLVLEEIWGPDPTPWVITAGETEVLGG